MIGVLMSATLPARLGEPARATVLARRTGRMRETFPVLLGTLVSQSVLNIVALVLLGGVIVASTDLFHSSSEKLFLISFAPLALLLAVIFAPQLVRQGGSGRVARVADAIRAALVRVRLGLHVFRDPRRAPVAVAAQLSAWATPAARLLRPVHGARPRQQPRDRDRRRRGGPVRGQRHRRDPGDAVEHRHLPARDDQRPDDGFAVSRADALAYGVILQAVEIATAVGLGLPALVREGVTWQDMRLRVLSRRAGPPAPPRARRPSRRSASAAILRSRNHQERPRDPDLRRRRNHRTPRSKAWCDRRDRWR